MCIIPLVIESLKSCIRLFCLLMFLFSELHAQTPPHYFHLPTNSGVNNLFFNQAACEKFQFIYTQSEIANMVTNVTGPVSIDTIWFRFGGGSSNPTTVLTNFEIRMGHTTLNNPGTQFNANFNAGPPQTVLSSSSYSLTPIIGAAGVPSNNWTFIVLQTPFDYNFTDNLCVELSFSASSAAIAGNFADNGGVPISQYANISTATTASATSSRPMFGISSGQGSSGSTNCNPSGNLIIYSNYDGGILTINVDQNIPNLKVGICTYEPIQVSFTRPFVGNITQVVYAGMNSNQNNNNCGLGNFTTSVTGVPSNIVTISPPMNPPQVGYTPTHGNGSGPWGGGMLGVAGLCDTTINAGGGNTPDEVVYYFLNATANGLTAGIYTCTITNECGNSSTQTFTIDEANPYQLNATVIQPTCGNNNGCIYFDPSPAGTYFYNWPFPTIMIVDSICDLAPGSYDITINSADGCPIDTTITLTETNSFNVIESISSATCGASDGSISLMIISGAAPFSYSWSTGGSIGNVLSNVASGNYAVTITDQNGCIVTENYTVPQINLFSFDVFPSSATINPGESIQLNASGAIAYSWSPSASLNCSDCSNPIATPLENTMYVIVGENESGCVDTTIVYITIEEDEFLYIPNTFTPDGDEFNHTFQPIYSDAFDDLNYELTIFNRWGEVIFQTNNKNIGWDGSYNGVLQPNGVYTYSVQLKRKSNDSVKTYHGHINLLK